MNKQALLLAIGTLLLVAAIPKEEPGEIYADSIEGSWAETTNDRWAWEFRNGKLTIFLDGKPHIIYQYKVDSSRSPMTLYLVGHRHAIFSVTGDAMKLSIIGGIEPYVLKRTSR